ncbi:hypothetical protein CL658_01890 [bacterium]|nr:hypothetical protein [bacterium]
MNNKKKILYAINGTGQGHISRAKSLIPYLKHYVDVDILVSGKLHELNLDTPIRYNLEGFTFVYEGGGVNWIKTILKAKPIQFIYDLFKIDLKAYDMVVCDFEPISAWASFFRFKHCINVSHQASYYTLKTPRPRIWPFFILAELFLRFYSFSFEYIGVHFKPYNTHVFPPVLHDDIINAKPSKNNYISIYLSAFSLQEQIDFFKHFPDYTFEIFHNHCKEETILQNLRLFPLSDHFKDSLIHSNGYISNAGFESNAEALYLEKPLLCIPIKAQYEQYCNAAALKQLGVTIIKKLDKQKVLHWLKNREVLDPISVCNTDQFAQAIIKKIRP